jgi:hypothetical protein
MPYRRKGKDQRRGFYTHVTLPKFGRIRKWTGISELRVARAMEAWLIEMAVSRPEVVEALVAGKVNLPRLWVAKIQSTPDRDRLAEVIREDQNQLLSAAAEEYLAVAQDARVQDGLRRLSTLADQVEARRAAAAGRRAPRSGSLPVSWIVEPTNISELYALAEETQSAGGVRRSLHRAVSELLAHKYGKARLHGIMLDVRKPEVSDERLVRVSAEEVQILLREAGKFEPLFRDFVALAILLAVDRAPLLRIRPRFFNEREGTLEAHDTKTSHRHRMLVLPAPAVAILSRLCKGLKPDDLVFPWSESAIRNRWEAARDRAAEQPSRNQRERGAKDKSPSGLPTGVITLAKLRFKDLRHLLPTAWSALKLPQRELQEVLGHAPGSKMTDRYITPVGAREHMDKVAEWLGLDQLPWDRIETGMRRTPTGV